MYTAVNCNTLSGMHTPAELINLETNAYNCWANKLTETQVKSVQQNIYLFHTTCEKRRHAI